MFGIEKEVIDKVQEEFIEAYKAFLAFEPDPLVNNYELEPNEVIVKIWEFQPSTTSNIIINELGETVADEFYRTIPIVKVLASNCEKYPVGSFGKLTDFNAASISNPYYDEWKKALEAAPMLASQEQGKEPSKVANRFAQSYGKYMFIINNVKLFTKEEDLTTLKISSAFIETKIKDPLAFIQ